MGKIKERMYGSHFSAPKINDMNQTPSWENNNTFECSSLEVQNVITHNPFQNVAIPSSALEQKLAVYSKKNRLNFKVTRSAVCSFEISPKMLRKKQRAKRFPFPEVVTSILEFHKKREKEAKKEKASILGNYDALKSALPTLQQLQQENNINKEIKPRVAKRFSKQAEMEEDIQTYKQVLIDPQYASDPFGIISAQLKQKLMSGSL